MLKRFFIFLIFVGVSLSGFEKQRMAIFSIKPINTSNEVATAFLMSLSSELTNSEKIVNIERSDIEKVFKEQALQLSGCTSTECTAQVGRILGADKILIGSISKVGGSYLISVRAVDVTLGSIVFEIGPVEAKNSHEFPNVARKIVKDIEKKIPIIPEIVGFLGENPVLDVGKNFGLNVGDVFNVVRITGVVKNKAGKVIFRNEEVIGKVRIKSVQQEGAVCEVLEKKKAFAEGDFAKTGGVMVDKVPPVITHKPVLYAISGKSLQINAYIKDNLGVKEAYILFKGKDKVLRKVNMRLTEKSEYAGIIPAKYVKPKSLLYSIEAKDFQGNIGVFNNNGKYFVVKVKKTAGKKGSINKGWIAGGTATNVEGGVVDPTSKYRIGESGTATNVGGGIVFSQASPIDKGSKIISARLNFSVHNYSTNWQDYSTNWRGKKYNAYISIAYFIVPKLAVGGEFSTYGWNSKIDTLSFNSRYYGMGPSLIYFFGEKQIKTTKGTNYKYVGFSIQMSIKSDTSVYYTYSSSLIANRLKMGLIYLLSKNIGISLEFFYEMDIPISNETSSNDMKISANDMEISAGLTFFY